MSAPEEPLWCTGAYTCSLHDCERLTVYACVHLACCYIDLTVLYAHMDGVVSSARKCVFGGGGGGVVCVCGVCVCVCVYVCVYVCVCFCARECAFPYFAFVAWMCMKDIMAVCVLDCVRHHFATPTGTLRYP